tara:strand:- start:1088 stop:1615 length:528 start_codon:yes stop_codon:yes gene_type:complete
MATKKTSMFTLTERLTLSAVNTQTFATIDLGSYVDVADRQALQIHSVDYIFQGTAGDTTLTTTFGTDGSEVQVQLTDLNRGGLVFCNDRAMVSSARFLWAGTHADREADMYPDMYGKGSDDGRFVVNDQLYITGIVNDLASSQSCNVTIRVNCSVVTLSAKDFMAIAIQSTAADN